MTFPAPSECTLVGSAAPLIHGNGGSSVPAGVGATVVFPGTVALLAGPPPLVPRVQEAASTTSVRSNSTAPVPMPQIN